MKMRKILALVLSVVMVMLILPITVSAEDTVIPISECGGVITSGNTYSISTAEEFLLFEEMNNNCDGATIILTNNITIHNGIFSVDENQVPLYKGTFVLPEPIQVIDDFRGTFDGQGHTISGLYVEDKNSGLFEKASNSASVKNIDIENSLFIAQEEAGSLFGSGYNHNTKVKNCYSDAIVFSEHTAGGIVGGFGGSMSNCCFKGTVILNGYGAVGGIVGEGYGTFSACANSSSVYAIDFTSYVGGFAGEFTGNAYQCYNTGYVYSAFEAGGFVGVLDGYLDTCYTTGVVQAFAAGKFMATCLGDFGDIKSCLFVGKDTDSADPYGMWEAAFDRYVESMNNGFGLTIVPHDKGVWPINNEFLINNGDKWNTYSEDFVLDTGNENNGYIVHKNLQRRTVAPSITNVEYEKSSETRNTFNVTVEGRPAMIQFIEPTDGTRTYDRNHKNVTIKSYDADGNEVNSLDRTVSYEIWSIYSNMMPNVEIRTRAKYLSDAIYTWDSETYNFPMILSNPIVSMELSKVEGEKDAVPATVVTDEKTEKVMLKMPNGTSSTISTFTTDENGNRVFTGKAWMNEDGTNEIKVYIRRGNMWKLVGTLEYTVE